MVRKLTISFGLVNIPVKIHNATKEQKISFNQITPCCRARVNSVLKCQTCGREVSRAEVSKGYEVEKGNYVVLSQEEVKSVRLPSAKSIQIEGFVAHGDIDPLLFAETFYVEPDKGGERAYSLLADALGLLQKVAVGKVVMNGKEQVVAINRWRNLLLLTLLWYPSEIRNPPEVQLLELSGRERELAKQLIEAGDGVDFQTFKDRYVEALKEMIRAKLEGREVKPIEEAKPTEEDSIAKALEASLKQRLKVKAQA